MLPREVHLIPHEVVDPERGVVKDDELLPEETMLRRARPDLMKDPHTGDVKDPLVIEPQPVAVVGVHLVDKKHLVEPAEPLPLGKVNIVSRSNAEIDELSRSLLIGEAPIGDPARHGCDALLANMHLVGGHQPRTADGILIEGQEPGRTELTGFGGDLVQGCGDPEVLLVAYGLDGVTRRHLRYSGPVVRPVVHDHDAIYLGGDGL